jgi:hypothetical protein
MSRGITAHLLMEEAEGVAMDRDLLAEAEKGY